MIHNDFRHYNFSRNCFPHTQLVEFIKGGFQNPSKTVENQFEVHLQKERLGVLEFSQELSRFFMERWREVMPADYSGPDMTFIIGGYDPDAAYGKVCLFHIPVKPEPEPQHENENDFGMTWG